MSDTTALRRPAIGWTITDGERRRAPTGSHRTRSVTVDVHDLAAASQALAQAVPDGTPAALRTTPGGLEITVATSAHAFWETAVVPVDVTSAPIEGGADISRLHDVAQRLAGDRSTVDLRVTGSGRVQLDGVDLPAVDQLPSTPARPRSAGVVEQRIELPASLPEGVPIRLSGLALALPTAVRSRFTRRGISLASLYETGDGWFLSGIAQGRPMYALVGRVAVY